MRTFSSLRPSFPGGWAREASGAGAAALLFSGALRELEGGESWGGGAGAAAGGEGASAGPSLRTTVAVRYLRLLAPGRPHAAHMEANTLATNFPLKLPAQIRKQYL